MSDSVVRHVDGRIRERFDELCCVPWEPGAKTDPPGACPVLEPVHCPVKLKTNFRRDQRHIPKVVADLLFPCMVAVFQEPLVMQDLDFNSVATATDDRPGVKFVHDLRTVFFDHERCNIIACYAYGFSPIPVEELTLGELSRVNLLRECIHPAVHLVGDASLLNCVLCGNIPVSFDFD